MAPHEFLKNIEIAALYLLDKLGVGIGDQNSVGSKTDFGGAEIQIFWGKNSGWRKIRQNSKTRLQSIEKIGESRYDDCLYNLRPGKSMIFQGLGPEAVSVTGVGAIHLANFIQQRLVLWSDGCREKGVYHLVGLFERHAETIKYLSLQCDAIGVQVRR